MPGIFGVSGSTGRCWDGLVDEYSRIWGEVDSKIGSAGSIGGHAHRPYNSVVSATGDVSMAVDGEAAAYEHFRRQMERGSLPPVTRPHDGFAWTRGIAFNLAAIDSRGRLTISGSPLGSFPLYYARTPGGFVFSTLLRPLSIAMGSLSSRNPDLVGAVQWLRRHNQMFGTRTFFQGIHRLLPGQVVEYDPMTDHFAVHETSDIWTGGYEPSVSKLADVVDRCWDALTAALRVRTSENHLVGLMMSAGWDSRVLYAGLADIVDSASLLCWSHGDTRSRELSIVRRLCDARGVRALTSSNSEAFDLGVLDDAFSRAETLTSLEWTFAARALAKIDVGWVTAGTFGEILGGDQGPDDLARGIRKMPAAVRELIRSRTATEKTRAPDPSSLRQAFALNAPSKPWYLLQDAWRSIPDVSAMLNADLDSDLARLLKRGIEDHNQLLEAFLVESRQTQFTARQLLSCRVATNVSIPYEDHALLRLVSRIPWSVKYHRSLMRAMLQRHAPDLLDAPMAATLVSANAPIFVQEATRFVRHADENFRWRVHNLSRGLVPYPRYGWWWYEFLRSGEFLHGLLSDLRCDFWDLAAIRARVADSLAKRARCESTSVVGDTVAHLLRIATVDRMLR